MSKKAKQFDPEAHRELSIKAATTRGDKIFYAINAAILALLLLVVVLPIIYLFANSFSTSDAVAAGRVSLWPQIRNADGSFGIGIDLAGYKAVLGDPAIMRGYWNTIVYTVSGTLINMVLTILAAYPLSRSDMAGRNGIMMLFAFTMIFAGGMIPSYILMQNLNIINTRWVMILPGAISVYNLVIMRTFFQNTIPRELLEAAQVDGCNDFRFLIQVVLPLSKAVIAVITLYYAVAHWNAYFNAFLYITDQSLYPLQIILKDILISNTISPEMLEGQSFGAYDINLVHVIKYASIIVACLPIWCIYPFVQKYFVQGVMIGSIKG